MHSSPTLLGTMELYLATRVHVTLEVLTTGSRLLETIGLTLLMTYMPIAMSDAPHIWEEIRGIT